MLWRIFQPITTFITSLWDWVEEQEISAVEPFLANSVS